MHTLAGYIILSAVVFLIEFMVSCVFMSNFVARLNDKTDIT